jgi:hypothetical protein
MSWVLVLGAVAILALLLLRRRTKSAPAAKVAPHAAGPVRRIQDLKAFEGSLCIYEEGATVLRGRLQQVDEGTGGLVFRVQVLRAEGLSDIKEDHLNLETSWTSLGYSSKLIHAHYTNWKLFFDKDLVQKVLDLGQSSTDSKAIRRTLLEHQMK